jgi:hypothetical protein
VEVKIVLKLYEDKNAIIIKIYISERYDDVLSKDQTVGGFYAVIQAKVIMTLLPNSYFTPGFPHCHSLFIVVHRGFIITLGESVMFIKDFPITRIVGIPGKYSLNNIELSSIRGLNRLPDLMVAIVNLDIDMFVWLRDDFNGNLCSTIHSGRFVPPIAHVRIDKSIVGPGGGELVLSGIIPFP